MSLRKSSFFHRAVPPINLLTYANNVDAVEGTREWNRLIGYHGRRVISSPLRRNYKAQLRMKLVASVVTFSSDREVRERTKARGRRGKHRCATINRPLSVDIAVKD